MNARLVIQNFGPIDNLDIEIKKFNVLIGPHASGKSTIAKVLCAIHAFYEELLREPEVAKFLDKTPIVSSVKNYGESRFKRILVNYRIENFIKKYTFLYFEDDYFSFHFDTLNQNPVIQTEKKDKNVNRAETYYIPAERIALPMISESLFELTLEQSTIPHYFLQFGKDFTLARRNQNIFNVPILKVEFEHKDGRNTVVIDDDISLFLEETSSAIQANLPLLVILQYPVKMASLFVVEELELHGFPILQKQLLSYLVEKTQQPSLNKAYVVLPTHSPYILSAANNLLFAAKVGKQNQESLVAADKIIGKKSWINSEDFSAYHIADGTATSIVNEQGLINENELDGISESLAEEFDALMDLYKPVNV